MSASSFERRVVVLPLLMLTACSAEEPPPLSAPEVGLIVGQAYIADPEPRSVGGAVVEVYGTSARAVTEAGKQFVLDAVPVGTHTLSIQHPDTERAARLEVEIAAANQMVELAQDKTTLKKAATAKGQLDVAGGEPAGASVYLVGGNAAQLTLAGSDGSYVLKNLPVGPAQIGFSKPGAETKVQSVTLQEGENTLDAVTLGGSEQANLTLEGEVKLGGATNHAGVAVVLDGGEQVTTTNAAGNFTFAALAPGVYSIRAEKSGYQSVELPQVALDASGSKGLVPMFMAEGGDLGAASAAGDDIELDVESPAPGETLVGSVSTLLAADVSAPPEVVVPTDAFSWSYRRWDGNQPPTEPPQFLGTGRSLVTQLDAGAQGGLVDITVELAFNGITVSDTVTHALEPLQPSPSIVAEAGGAGQFALPEVSYERDAQGVLQGVELDIVAGQPVALTPTNATTSELGEVSWSSDSGYAFEGTADLSSLPEGLHVFSVAVGGQPSGIEVRVQVSPFAWEPSVEKPVLEPAQPYFVETGLPLEVSVNHPFQTGFAAEAIRWSETAYGPIGVGRATRTYALPAGTGVVQVSLTDALGNRAVASGEYVLQAVEFTAELISPAPGTSKLAGDSVDFAVSYAHSLVPDSIPEADLRVRYISSIQGLLSDASGRSEFGVNETATIGDLVVGNHTMTARISDGAAFAEAKRALEIRGPGVAGTLRSPGDGAVFFPGDSVLLDARITADSSVGTLRYSWFLDGQELDASWGGYGSDATDPARQSIDLGPYQPSTPPFDDPRWGAGEHIIELFARLPGVDSAYPERHCVSVPGEAVCLRARIELAPQAPDLCATTNQGTTISGNVVWDGIKRLNCNVRIEGGSVEILSGARIIAASDATNAGITLVEGALSIGQAGTAQDVVLEAQGASPGRNAWRGIELAPSYNTGPAVLTIDNARVRHAEHLAEASSRWNDVQHSAEIRDVVVEAGAAGLYNFCPNVLQNVTFRNLDSPALREGSGGYQCDRARTYSGLTVEDAPAGLQLARLGGHVQVEDSTFRRIADDAIAFTSFSERADLTVRRSVFDTIGSSQTDAAIGLGDRTCPKLRLERSTVRASKRGISYGVCDGAPRPGRRLEIYGNIFENNEAAIVDRSLSTMPADVHLNTFMNNAINVDLQSNYGGDVAAQGNYFGPQNAPDTTAGAALALPAGRLANVPGIEDYFDNNSNERLVRFSNPLTSAAASPEANPVTFIREPRRTRSYNPNRCLPLVASAPLGHSTLDDCTWWLDGNPGDGQQLTADVDGCADVSGLSIEDGVHSLALECPRLDTGGNVVATEVHRTEFLVDNGAFGGRQRRPSETWSDEVVLHSDVVVPEGHTLTIEAGTKVRFREQDARFFERYPADDLAYNSVNGEFGDRRKIDIYVDGLLQASGGSEAPVVFEPASGAAQAARWGSILVGVNATADIAHAEVRGATHALHGHYDPDAPGSAPTMDVSETLFEYVSGSFRGVCPVNYSRNTVRKSGSVSRWAHCPSSFVVDSCVFEQIGGTDPSTNNSSAGLLWLKSYSSNTQGVEVRVVNTEFIRGGQNKGLGVKVDGAAFSRLRIEDSRFANFYHVAQLRNTNVPGLLELQNSVVSDFEILLEGPMDLAAINVSDSVLRDGASIVDQQITVAPEMTFTGNLVRDVAVPFTDIQLGPEISDFVVNDNQFENAVTVFELGVYRWADGATGFNFARNNYVGTSNLVLDLNEDWLQGCPVDPYCTQVDDPDSDPPIVQIDMSNSYFGDAVSSEDDLKVMLGEVLGMPPPSGRQIDTTDWRQTPLNLTLPAP